MKIKPTHKIIELAQTRQDQLASAINGDRRLRSYRWEGATSLRDTYRIYDLVCDMANGVEINHDRFFNLQDEIDTFNSVLGSHLSTAIEAVI